MRSRPRKLVLLLLCVAQLMISIDFSIVNVALPAMQADLDMSDTGFELAFLVGTAMLLVGIAVASKGLDRQRARRTRDIEPAIEAAR